MSSYRLTFVIKSREDVVGERKEGGLGTQSLPICQEMVLCFENLSEWFAWNQISVWGVCLSKSHPWHTLLLAITLLNLEETKAKKPCSELLGHYKRGDIREENAQGRVGVAQRKPRPSSLQFPGSVTVQLTMWYSGWNKFLYKHWMITLQQERPTLWYVRFCYYLKCGPRKVYRGMSENIDAGRWAEMMQV